MATEDKVQYNLEKLVVAYEDKHKERLSVNRLSEASSVSRQVIYRMQKGKPVVISSLLKLAQFFQCSLDELVVRENNPLTNGQKEKSTGHTEQIRATTYRSNRKTSSMLIGSLSKKLKQKAQPIFLSDPESPKKLEELIKAEKEHLREQGRALATGYQPGQNAMLLAATDHTETFVQQAIQARQPGFFHNEELQLYGFILPEGRTLIGRDIQDFSYDQLRHHAKIPIPQDRSISSIHADLTLTHVTQPTPKISVILNSWATFPIDVIRDFLSEEPYYDQLSKNDTLPIEHGDAIEFSEKYRFFLFTRMESEEEV